MFLNLRKPHSSSLKKQRKVITFLKTVSCRAKIDEGGINIKEFLSKNLGLSSTLIKKVKYGGVFINGENVHMRATVKNGDSVTVIINEKINENILPINIELDIVYEDGFILAVNKPTGMPTHPSRGNTLPTLANAVCAHLGAEFVFRAVNRLDKDTSGLVLIAKDAITAAKLGKMMKERKISKKYEAVVTGVPIPEKGIISAPIEREDPNGIKRCVRDDGKVAITEYRVIKKLSDGNALCEFILHTGRTHQIRVHSSYIGHPLMGDEMYGGGPGTYRLHCTQMSFKHPASEDDIQLISNSNFNI